MTLRPLKSSNKYSNNLGEINDMVRQLNREQQVKTFKAANDINAVIIGKYMEGRYGLVISDSSGNRRVLLGQAPDDGRPGHWISDEGQDVITLLGG